MSTKEEIAAVYDRIKFLCKRKNVSQTEMCNVCNINAQSHRGRISKGIAPDVFDLYKIAKYLNTTVEYLITGEEKNIYKEKYDNLKNKIESVLKEES